MERTFDRLVEFDPRSRAFPIAALLDYSKNPRSYTWGCTAYNDQGVEGACVGFAWSHELAARPKMVPADANLARNIYYRARQLDPWPGEDYDGTSVLAGVKAVQELTNNIGEPLIEEYRWAFGIDDLILAVGYRGPAVLGVNWYEGMWDTDDKGFIHPVGQIMGGHALIARGFKVVKNHWYLPISWSNMNRDKSYFLLHNSWGPYWGVNGTAKISVNDMATLLANQGEACIPTKRNFLVE